MNENDFFEKLGLIPTLKNTEYVKLLKKILFNEKYETFLFLDEFETKIIRMNFNPNKQKIYKEIGEEFGLSKNVIGNRMRKIFEKVPAQINETLNFYEENKFSIKKIKEFKTNLKNQEIDQEIKEFLIDNNIHTLEQLLVENPIDWNYKPIRDVLKVTNYIDEKYKVKFNKKDEQKLIQKIDLTNEDLDELEKREIITVSDIKNLTHNIIENVINLPDSLKEKIIKNVRFRYKKRGFFKNLDLILTDDKIRYVDFLEGILFNEKYKTFLFLDEIDTKIIRLRFDKYGERKLTYEQIGKYLGIPKDIIANKFNTFYQIIPGQINKTFKFYKKYEMPPKIIKYFKMNIEELSIDGEIKKFIIENGINTLEQLLVKNSIDWSNKSIRTIKNITEYFEKIRIDFYNKKYEQLLIEQLNLTNEELEILEKNGIITCNDIKNLEFKLFKSLDISDTLQEKIKKNIDLNHEIQGFFKAINISVTQENAEYIYYLENILFNDKYKTFLFFDEIDTKIIRTYYNIQGEKKLKQTEISKVLGITGNQVIQRLKKIFFYTPVQINKTFNYYKKNNIPQEKIDYYKINILDTHEDNEIKQFLIENGVNTLEKLLIENPIEWGNKPIRIIKKISEQLEKNRIDFYNKKYEQQIIKTLNLSNEEIKALEKINIITFNDLNNIEYNDLKLLDIPDVLKEKIKKNLNPLFENRGFFKKINIPITQENTEYMDYLEKILFDNNYKSFLFLSEIETKIIRLHYNIKGEKRLTTKEVAEVLGVEKYVVDEKIKKIYHDISTQIEKTYEFYKKNNIPPKIFNNFKTNIKNIEIDNDIKNFMIENQVSTLEELLVQNPIDWSNQPIKMIKKVTDYFKKSGIQFETLKPEQEIITGFSEQMLNRLNEKGITIFNDIYRIGYKELMTLNIPYNLKELIKRKKEKNIKKTFFLKKWV